MCATWMYNWFSYSKVISNLHVLFLFDLEIGLGCVRGGGMYKGGGPWPPQNSEIFKNIYTIILIFLKFSLQK